MTRYLICFWALTALWGGARISTASGTDPASQQPPPQPRPTRKQVLAWGDVRYGFQHDSVSHALATIERLGRESGLYDTYIRTDSQLITKQPIMLGAVPATPKI